MHQQWNNINSLLEAQHHLLKYLGDDPFASTTVFDDDFVKIIFVRPLTQLGQALVKAIEFVGPNTAERNIPSANWERLKGLSKELSLIQSTGSALAPFRLRMIAVKITTEIVSLKSQDKKVGLNKEQIREVATSAKEVERLACLFDLHRAIHMARSTNEQIGVLVRDRSVNTGELESLTSVVALSEIIKETINYFRDKADKRGIKINLADYSNGATIKVERIELQKAIGNLLDNAIKYTGELPDNSKYDHTWIDIKLTKMSQIVVASFESWGIPVTDEELKGEFIFKEGYRGIFARQAGIEGTGTGLPDARAFAQKYGGDVAFTSVSVKDRAFPQASTKTVVTLALPLHRD